MFKELKRSYLTISADVPMATKLNFLLLFFSAILILLTYRSCDRNEFLWALDKLFQPSPNEFNFTHIMNDSHLIAGKEAGAGLRTKIVLHVYPKKIF